MIRWQVLVNPLITLENGSKPKSLNYLIFILSSIMHAVGIGINQSTLIMCLSAFSLIEFIVIDILLRYHFGENKRNGVILEFYLIDLMHYMYN